MKSRILLAISVLPALWAQSALPVPPEGSVTLPVDEYNRLVELAAKPAPKTAAPPFSYALKNAQLDWKVGVQSVTGSVEIEGELLAAGEQKVPLVSGMIVLDAQQHGKPLAISQDGAVHAAILAGPGEFTATLATGLPLIIEPGRASFQLLAPSAGAVRLNLSVPGEQTQVKLSPGLITSRISRDGQTLIEATLVPGQTANVWWAARLTAAPPAAAKPARFQSDVKTLISVSEAEVAIAALAEITVTQGEPASFELAAPAGYELTGATGPTLATSGMQNGRIVLSVATPAARTHQFLISLVKSNSASKVEVPLVGFAGSERETGEVLVEAEGTVELSAAERGGLRRMDLREAGPYLLSMARHTVHAAFRYQKKPAESPALALEWVRFPDSAVIPAVAQRAEVTTLVTSEGRSLTEVKLTLKNQSQPFLKVALPAGASILSADVAGEKVKPVQGADGARVPLLRANFRPSGAYTISFVFVHAGAPFEKKGGAELSLPKMDVPVGLLQWEVFLPDRYKVADFGGDALAARLLPLSAENEAAVIANAQMGGRVLDPTGAGIPNVKVVVRHLASGATQTTFTDASGQWLLAAVPSGKVQVIATATGFNSMSRDMTHDAVRGSRFDMRLNLGSMNETVEVTTETPVLNTSSAQVSQVQNRKRQNAASPVDQSASANVADLQRRVVGVLPIAVNVPRTGNSYRFVRPLVVDEETTVSFSYRSK